jgi:hypothetical protein
MLPDRNYYYSQAQADEFAAFNRSGGRLILSTSPVMAPVQYQEYRTMSYYNEEIYTQSFPVGELPDPNYSDWELVGSGPITGHHQTKERF